MSSESTPRRDEELGALLRELKAPEHGPDFWADLERRLDREQPAPPRRRNRRRKQVRISWGLRIAAAAVVAGAVLVAVGIPGTDHTPRFGGAEPATAAQVKAKMRAALNGLQNLSGVLAYDGSQTGDEQRWTFTLTAAGDVRLAGPGSGEGMTYDAATGTARSAFRSSSIGGGPLFYAERRGVAPGLPDQGPPTWTIPSGFSAYVRAALAARDVGVREVRYDGRPAWRLSVDTVPNAIVPEFSGDRFEITVDQETGVPVRVLETRRGDFLREYRITGLSVNAELPADAFRLDFPSGAEVMRSDDGFRRVDLGDVKGSVGYAPLVPARVPDGYRLAEVAVATTAMPTGVEGGNPPSRMVVSLSYRRGLDQFIVTTRLAGAGAGLWRDPLATGEGFRDDPERLVLAAGALRGQRAELLLVPRGIPHVWARTDELVVTVGGDLSRAELVQVAESLERQPE